MIEIVERFITIAGEAPIIGQPVYLNRFSRCNVECAYCDTPYKNEVNFRLEPEDLIRDIREKRDRYPSIKILFTGGEPLLGCRQEQLEYVMRRMKDTEFYVETNGTIKINDRSLNNCHYVCDYKSPSAKVSLEFCEDNFKVLNSDRDCIKLVVKQCDLPWLKKKIKQIKNINCNLPLFISPAEGEPDLSIFADFIIQNKLSVNFSLQLHRVIWPDKTRGV